MLSSHKIHIHKAQLSSAQLSSHKIHICNAQLSSQEIHIHKPQLSNQRYPAIDIWLLLFIGRLFHQMYSTEVNRFVWLVLAIWRLALGLLFSPFHCMLLFYLLIYFHPFIACFPLELCSRFLFFIYASLRLRFSLASLYQISLALLRQVSLASLRFLPVVLASHATWRFSLSFASFENYVTWTSLKANCEWKNVAFQWCPENYHTRTPVARFIVLQAVKLLPTDFMM